MSEPCNKNLHGRTVSFMCLHIASSKTLVDIQVLTTPAVLVVHLISPYACS